MKKLHVIAMADRREALLKGLLHLGCVEISEPEEILSDPQWASLFQRGTSALARKKGELSDVNTALDAIRQYAGLKDGMFIKRHPITEAEFLDAGAAEKAQAACDAVRAQLGTLAQAQSEQGRLESRIAALTPWKDLDLPLEQSGLPLAQLLGMAKPGALALGGKVTDSARTIARAAGVELVDYFARPELTVYNAIPTAEGCIGILLERRSRTLWGAAVLLLGFGPVGRALAVRLAALGARVTVAARRPVQRAMAEEQGLRAVPLTDLAAAAAAFDTVVNTIPAPVLTAQVLAALPKGCLIVDLASKPGGTDFAAARRLGHDRKSVV